MRSLNFKVMVDGRTCPAHPALEPGRSPVGRGPIYRVTDIPDGVPTSEVARRLDGTTLVGRHTARFDELAVGRILR